MSENAAEQLGVNISSNGTENANVEDYHFKMDKNQLSNLLLEAQTVTPEEKSEMDVIIKEAHERFLDKLGEYIDLSNKITDMESRFIFTDSDTMEAIEGQWGLDTVMSSNRYSKKSWFRAYEIEGGYIVGTIVDVWGNFSLDEQSRLINQTGSEESAKDLVKKAVYQNLIAHEMTHLYQASTFDLPYWLKETQAFWVGREIWDENVQFHAADFDNLADFYQGLLDKYGEDRVQQLCFCKDKEYIRYTLLLIGGEFTEEVQKELFPDRGAAQRKGNNL